MAERVTRKRGSNASRPRLRLPRKKTSETQAAGEWRRKNVVIDQQKLDKARELLGSATETAAIDEALDLVAFRGEVLKGLRRLRAAGGLSPPHRR